MRHAMPEIIHYYICRSIGNLHVCSLWTERHKTNHNDDRIRNGDTPRSARDAATGLIGDDDDHDLHTKWHD